MAKADRLLYLINLIKSNQSLTSKDLAEKCRVSERTIFRDLNSLASATFPLYHDHGYRFLEGTFLPTLNLTDEELSLLQFAFEFSPLKSEPSLYKVVKNIFNKLETSRKKPLLEKQRESNHTKELENSPLSSTEISRFSMMFKLLHQAIVQKHVAKIKYHNREALIEPYALVQKNPKWLVLSYSHDCEKIASFDISKIESLSLTTQPFKSKLSLDKVFAVHP